MKVYTYDSYPNFAYLLGSNPQKDGNMNDRHWSMDLTQVRSICPHFGIMEQQSGANGWNTRMEAPSPKPGQMMLWTMQSIAHGADYVSFFRWRTSIMGTEIYWHGILDYDNRDNRKLAEIRKISERVQSIREVTGARNKAVFALLRDYENIWDAEVDIWHDRLISGSEEEIFRTSQLTHTPMDFVNLTDDMDVKELFAYPLILHFGGTFTFENTKKFLNYTGICSPFKGCVELPWECELVIREKEGKTYLFVLNYSKHPHKYPAQ